MATLNEKSPGVLFMQTTDAVLPRSMGDRERVAALHTALTFAIDNRVVFHVGDGDELNHLRIRTCVGVFRPMDDNYYLRACMAGGTYAAAWEKHHAQKPWKAAFAVMPDPRHGWQRKLGRLRSGNRVTRGLGVLLPQEFSLAASAAEEARFGQYEGNQVWWCTSVTDEEITLCRYPLPEDHAKHYGDAPFVRSGRAAKIRKLSRDEWAYWQAQMS